MNVYVARQPIFNRRNQVVGYELLFRNGSANHYAAADGDLATAAVIVDSLFVIGFNNLTGGKKAFINFTENLLKRDEVKVLPQDKIIVEILETVPPTKENLEACRALKRAGFILALDDFVFKAEFIPFVELADIIKIDFLASDLNYCQLIVEQFKNRNIKFLAEKVETKEQYQSALVFGYSYFQGYFFSKPVIITGQDIPSHKQSYLRLLKEVTRPTIELEDLEAIIQRDVALTYKLLKFINSAAFAFRCPVRSIKQALALLGKREVVKWLSLLVTKMIAEDAPEEIVTSSILKGRIGELIVSEIGMKERGADAFLMGLFSKIDVLLGRPLPEIITDIPIDEDIKRALLGQKNVFYYILQSIDAFEAGRWDEYDNCLSQYTNNKLLFPTVYVEALTWVYQTGLG